MPKPKPFSRPSVSLGGVRKQWGERFALEAKVGDMWAGHGLIHNIVRTHDKVQIWAGAHQEPFTLTPTMRVMLFCEVTH